MLYELIDDLLKMKLTQNDITNMLIENNGTPTMAEVIEDLIESHDTSHMQTGVDYYHNRNDIRDRLIKYWKDGEEKTDETAANNRLPHNWQKLLVDQKANYLVGKPITFNASENSTEDEDPTYDEQFVEKVNGLLAEQFDDDIWELTKNASNKGVEWLHPYIRTEGDFDYVVIDAMEFIPIWETSKQKELSAGLRYYILNVNGEDRIKVEYWTRDTVTYYLESENGVLEQDGEEEPHFKYNGEPQSWGKVPFIPFKNNEEMIGDLWQYKELVDSYDRNMSDLDNNLEDIQDAVWVLKNYAGQSLQEFNDNLRYFKALKVDGEGDAKTITVDIPVEAKKEFLNRTEENIYTFGQGVNTKTDKFGNNPTGVALKFMYALLDLKADKTERKFKRAIRKFLWFIAEYLRYAEKKEFDYKAVQITFNKSMLINESEKIDSVQKSKGIISDETAVSNHPWVDDPAEELNRLKTQREDYVDLDSANNEPDEE
ncbi:phage portal protein [Iocasia frigidifontis]|uniref:Phage portal protein n=1 Tax=Iocasia fonsfrigidae TaxID=2682810 RepID=A0A8A7K5V6_9FIRM|nr:phage portal protein [Iocasia fonsfrigidae]QTL96550.1 phage portal protein [Iocasia fonsfrigidae]